MKIIKTFLAFIKKYPRSCLIVLTAIVAGLLVVCGGGIADFAKKPFWWNFWSIMAWVGFVVCLGGWIYIYTNKNALQDNNQ